MRCPKCGYHSFDYLDNCKKCGVDLTGQKLRNKYQGHAAPPVAGTPAVAAPAPAPLPEPDEAEEETIDFGFDVLDEEPAPASPGPGGESDALDAGPDDYAAHDHAAINLAAGSGLSLDQPFGTGEDELPDDQLPRLGNRFDF